MQEGAVIWLTGLPRAGKSTLSRQLEAELRQQGRNVEVLDGDEVRTRLSKGLGYAKEDRDENVRRISFVAHLLERNGVIVIVAAISPYRDARDQARREAHRFIEVYVDCPVDECIKRDFKGLYERALKGIISNFTGVSDPYEPPLSPEVTVMTAQETVGQGVAKIMAALTVSSYASATQDAQHKVMDS